MSAPVTVRVEYAGQKLTLRQWAAVTGKPYHVLYSRIFKCGWPVGAALTAPVYSTRRSKGQSPVQRALDMATGEDWTVTLPLAVTLMAVQDCRDPLYRDGVRLFFCGGLFEKLFALDGKAIYERMMSLVGEKAPPSETGGTAGCSGSSVCGRSRCSPSERRRKG